MFASLLRAPRDKHSWVALGKADGAQRLTKSDLTQKRVDCETVLDWEHFQADVAALATALDACPEHDRPTSGAGVPVRWLLFTENPYAFGVALTALAQTGAVAVLPPNGQPETLHELAEGCRGLLSDQANLATTLHTLDPLTQKRVDPQSLRALDPDALLLELCTSGTTGKRKRIAKRVRHIDCELTVLEKTFGSHLAPDTQIFATASHQHLYGLLFRVLWPLTSARPFRLESFLYPEEILPRMAQTDSCALISTPAHLKRLKDVSGLDALRSNCRAVFSSGGPLAEDTAAALLKTLGAAPIEIFGSTETGGVAWRMQTGSADAQAWSTLESVEIERRADDGRLRVGSPFVSEDADESTECEASPAATSPASCTMGDCVELLSDGRFLLLGRADRIVKIGEKRLSLPEMEARLLENPLLREIALVAISRSGNARVGAVAVLSESGANFLRVNGRRELAQELTRDLLGRWDRIVLPRAWRYVDRLPEDAQGKVTQSALQTLFAPGADTETRTGTNAGGPTRTTPATEVSSFDPDVKQPIVLQEERDATTCTKRCRVPENLAYCEGHFPMHPIVPGVVQLDWVMTAAQALWENAPVPLRIEALKFKKLLLPGIEFELSLRRTNDKLSFELRNPDIAEEVFSSGRFVITPKSDNPAPPSDAQSRRSTKNE